MIENKTLTGGDGEVLHPQDRVYSYDIDSKRYYGILQLNDDHPEVSEWYVEYDDGNECAVLQPNLIFKA